MKKLLALAIAASTIAFAAPASAATWQNINARQAQLEQRIDRGVRTGRLTRFEAMRLRTDFRSIAQLEQRYRRNGLSRSERRDLDRRFDRLNMQLVAELNDRQDRGDRGDHGRGRGRG